MAPRGILQDILYSLFEPGVNRGVLILMHGTFFCLLISLVWMIAMSDGRDIHQWILLILTLALYATLIWFVKEMMEALGQQQKIQEKNAKAKDDLIKKDKNGKNMVSLKKRK